MVAFAVKSVDYTDMRIEEYKIAEATLRIFFK